MKGLGKNVAETSSGNSVNFRRRFKAVFFLKMQIYIFFCLFKLLVFRKVFTSVNVAEKGKKLIKLRESLGGGLVLFIKLVFDFC